MQSVISRSLQDTRKFGRILSRCLQAGDILFLEGELGAGKSELTRGIAEGLQISSAIPSPTFTILNVYEQGRIPLYHFDWYRIQEEEELLEIGTDEYLFGQGVSVVEWPIKSKQYLQQVPHLLLQIKYTENADDRSIALLPRNGFRDFDIQGIYDEYTCV